MMNFAISSPINNKKRIQIEQKFNTMYHISLIALNKNEPESMIEANKDDIKNIKMSEKAEIYAIYDQYADEDERLERGSQNIQTEAL